VRGALQWVRVRARRLWRRLSDDRIWSSVLAGLVLAAIIAIAGGAWSLVKGDDAPPPKSAESPSTSSASPEPSPSASGVMSAIEAGNVLRVEGSGGDSEPRDRVAVRRGSDVELWFRLHNPGPERDLDHVRVQVVISPSTRDGSFIVSSIARAPDAHPSNTSDTATIRIVDSERAHAACVPGSTYLRDRDGLVIHPLPDGICDAGIDIGTLRVGIDELRFVHVRIHLGMPSISDEG
jgi:hypothetical protein